MSVYSEVQGNIVGRSVFDLSHVKRFTCDMGQLIPVTCIECVPGDRFKIGMECVTRFQPLVAPILDSVSLTVHYFFVPTRLLMNNKDDWETFLSGGKDGRDDSVTLPPWSFAGFDGNYPAISHPFSNSQPLGKYSLWDYFGLPCDKPSNDLDYYNGINQVNHVNCFAERAYNLIWNEYYRDENLVDEVHVSNGTVLYRSWKKDYFTSALPWQQRGVAPALPLSGTVPVNFVNPVSMDSFKLGSSPTSIVGLEAGSVASGYQPVATGATAVFTPGSKLSFAQANLGATATADLSNAATFDIATLRQCTQIQRWLELNARGGVRYTEFLRSHFGIAPVDEVLQRPEYIGGTKSDIVVSEVLQTSASSDTSPQGNLAGHGLGATTDLICDYTCKEFGYIIGIASYMPKPSYQQGVPRMFSRNNRYDFYFPEFAHLSEQAVHKGEIYATGTAADTEIFGYQGCYNEMRHMSSINCADMRDSFKYWHLGRIFNDSPSLNAGFLTTNSKYSGGIRKDIFASQNEPGLLVQYGNLITAVRPLPVYGTPGFVDHVGRM